MSWFSGVFPVKSVIFIHFVLILHFYCYASHDFTIAIAIYYIFHSSHTASSELYENHNNKKHVNNKFMWQAHNNLIDFACHCIRHWTAYTNPLKKFIQQMNLKREISTRKKYSEKSEKKNNNEQNNRYWKIEWQYE